jgi:hypothetical protein
MAGVFLAMYLREIGWSQSQILAIPIALFILAGVIMWIYPPLWLERAKRRMHR